MHSGRRTSSLRTGASRIAVLGVSLASGLALVAGLTLSSAVLSSPAGAAQTFTVTNGGDAGAGATDCTPTPVPDGCTLRDAVAAANADGSNVDTIDFAPSVTTVTLTSGVLDLTNSMVINGTGVTVNAAGNGTDGVFEAVPMGSTSVQITGLTIENGTHTAAVGDGKGGGFELQGGAALTLDSVTFTSNTATAGGGAIFDNGGALTVDDSTFNSNTSTGTTALTGGGAIILTNPTGSATISGSTFTGNGAEFGGGIDSASNATLTVSNSQINDSTCTGIDTEGCGIYDFGTAGTYDNVSLSGTSATGTTGIGDVEGGAVYLRADTDQVNGLTISGTTVTAPSVFGGALWNNAGAGTATTPVANASITNTTVNGTGATGAIEGGVIYNLGGLSLTAVNATGATLTAVDEAKGGFFYNDGTATVTDVTFGSGTVNVTGGATTFADGAALFDDNTLSAVNMTVDDTTATVAAAGAFNYGVDIASASGNTFTNATIANNAMSGPAGFTFGLFVTGGDSLSLLNTIVANTPATTNCGLGGGGAAITSQGHNLDNGASCLMTVTGDLQNTNPQVQPLANNGGSVLTGALASTSPAIDAGTNAGCPGTDARGVSRPQGTSCDIGAYEYVFPPPPTPAATTGYWMVGSDGGVFSYGNAGFHGSMGGQHLNAPVVGIAGTQDGGGYWEVASDGGIFNFGDAAFHGSMGGQHLNAPIVGIAATPDGGGYWEVASDGGVFAFGDARFYGSMGGQHLNAPIVGIASTHDGLGYWEVASDGGIFSFGDAHFYGSTGSIRLNKPIVAMTATADAGGYWLVASDGGIFNYGDAAFFGSAGSLHLAQPVVGMGVVPQGGGYWLFAADGGLFNYGSASYLGSVPGSGVHVTNIVGGATT